MANIGQTLPQPEEGWKRYDNTYSLIEYSGDFTHETVTGAYNNTTSFNPKGSIEGEINFFFEGSAIRILSPNHPTIRTPRASIFIDDIEYEVRCNYINDYTVLSFEKTDLMNALHKVTIKNFSLNTGTGTAYAPFGLDAIDINIDGQIKVPQRKMIVRNNDTQKSYSLDDNILIHLPNNTEETIMKHGIESAKTIALNVPFTNHLYPTTVVNKMSTVNIGKSDSFTIKETKVEEPWVPLLVWYETKMTSDTTPIPLVASAQGSNRTDYLPWKAFNGTIANVNDCWISGSEGVNSWIQIKYEKPYQMVTVEISPRNETDFNTSSPRDFDILGSNNGVDFDTLAQIRGQNSWQRRVSKRFTIPNDKEYSIYRIKTINTNGSSNVAIGDIIFGYKREVN